MEINHSKSVEEPGTHQVNNFLMIIPLQEMKMRLCKELCIGTGAMVPSNSNSTVCVRVCVATQN